MLPAQAGRYIPEGDAARLAEWICWLPRFCEAGAKVVAHCESNNPAAINPSSGAAGLFQIIREYHEDTVITLGYTWDQIFDPFVNADVAYHVWLEQGWRPWRASVYCHGLWS